jgi:hypothetical protein
MFVFLKNLVNSIPRRLQNAIRRKGNPTKYHAEELDI